MLNTLYAAPESYQVRPESIETFQPSYKSSKVKNKKDVIRNRISNFNKRLISQPKRPWITEDSR